MQSLSPVMRPHHICYTVSSIEESVATIAGTFGGGPFFYMERSGFDEITSRGEPASWDHAGAWGWVGGGFVEVQEFRSANPPRLADILNTGPAAINHVAVVADEFEQAGAELERLGCEKILQTRSGLMEIDFFDARGLLGHPIELHKATDAFAHFFRQIRAAAVDWDGSNPLRPVSDLG